MRDLRPNQERQDVSKTCGVTRAALSVVLTDIDRRHFVLGPLEALTVLPDGVYADGEKILSYDSAGGLVCSEDAWRSLRGFNGENTQGWFRVGIHRLRLMTMEIQRSEKTTKERM